MNLLGPNADLFNQQRLNIHRINISLPLVHGIHVLNSAGLWINHEVHLMVHKSAAYVPRVNLPEFSHSMMNLDLAISFHEISPLRRARNPVSFVVTYSQVHFDWVS